MDKHESRYNEMTVGEMLFAYNTGIIEYMTDENYFVKDGKIYYQL
mgnify:CR=1 FL=1